VDLLISSAGFKLTFPFNSFRPGRIFLGVNQRPGAAIACPPGITVEMMGQSFLKIRGVTDVELTVGILKNVYPVFFY